ncbi:MAG: hypothetical protein WBH57_10890 [Anaerolineae bacterium]
MRQPRVIPLTFSYLEMVEREVVTKMESPVELLAILRRCGEDLRSHLEKKGVSLEVNLPEWLLEVRGALICWSDSSSTSWVTA